MFPRFQVPHAGVSEVQASYTYAGYRPPQSQTQPANLVPASVQRPVQHSNAPDNINKVSANELLAYLVMFLFFARPWLNLPFLLSIKNCCRIISYYGLFWFTIFLFILDRFSGGIDSDARHESQFKQTSNGQLERTFRHSRQRKATSWATTHHPRAGRYATVNFTVQNNFSYFEVSYIFYSFSVSSCSSDGC